MPSRPERSTVFPSRINFCKSGNARSPTRGFTDNDKARDNLQFFVEVGLIIDNGQIMKLVESAKRDESVIPSISAGVNPLEIRYFIKSLPTIPNADAEQLLATALAEWRQVADIRASRVNSEKTANVIVVAVEGSLAHAHKVFQNGKSHASLTLPITFFLEHESRRRIPFSTCFHAEATEM